MTEKCNFCKGTGHDHSLEGYVDQMTPCFECNGAGLGKNK